MLQFLVFLSDFGILLKSLGPDTWKLWFLNAWTLALPLFLAGIEQSLPFLSEFGDQLTPQLGLNPTLSSKHIISGTFPFSSALS